MAAEILSVEEAELAQVIEVIRAGCMHFDDIAEFEHVVQQLQRWCDEEEEYLDSLPIAE